MKSIVFDICCWFGGSSIWNLLLAGGIGFFTAFAELLTRYNYDFKSIWRILAGWVYMIINATAGIAAFFIINEFALFNGKQWVGAVVAGTSAMLVLRSSFINIKYHDKPLEIGVASILQIFLLAANRGFAQERSINRWQKMKFMKDVDFEKAKEILPDLCFLSMKDVSDEEKKHIIQQIAAIGASVAENGNKSLLLGVILAEITDINMLEKAIENLGDTIKFDPATKPAEPIDSTIDKVMELVKKQTKS